MQPEAFHSLIDFISLLTCEQMDILNTALINALIVDIPDIAPATKESPLKLKMVRSVLK